MKPMKNQGTIKPSAGIGPIKPVSASQSSTSHKNSIFSSVQESLAKQLKNQQYIVRKLQRHAKAQKDAQLKQLEESSQIADSQDVWPEEEEEEDAFVDAEEEPEEDQETPFEEVFDDPLDVPLEDLVQADKADRKRLQHIGKGKHVQKVRTSANPWSPARAPRKSAAKSIPRILRSHDTMTEGSPDITPQPSPQPQEDDDVDMGANQSAEEPKVPLNGKALTPHARRCVIALCQNIVNHAEAQTLTAENVSLTAARLAAWAARTVDDPSSSVSPSVVQ